MKVCYVTMQFPAPSETFASNDVRWLKQRGVTLSVHGLRAPYRRWRELLAERQLAGLEVSHNSAAATLRGLAAAVSRPRLLLGALGWLISQNRGRAQHLLRSLALLPRAFDILRRIERERPDVVHVYWAHYPSLVGYLVQRRLPDTATSISFVAYDLEMEYGGSRTVARDSDVIRTLAQVNVPHIAEFARVPERRVEIVYDGVDVTRLERIAEGRSKVPGRMVTVGRLTAAKGMYEAIEVLARARQRQPQATLRILGDGPEADGLRRRAAELGVADSVEFLGHVDHDRVIEELAQAEIFLLLTKASGERLPNVVKEGMACRCLCITTPTAGIEELLVDGVHGFVVPAGEVDAPSRLVQRVLSGEIELQPIVRAANGHVTENFALEASCARYVELWNRALRQRREPTPEANPADHAVLAS